MKVKFFVVAELKGFFEDNVHGEFPVSGRFA